MHRVLERKWLCVTDVVAGESAETKCTSFQHVQTVATSSWWSTNSASLSRLFPHFISRLFLSSMSVDRRYGMPFMRRCHVAPSHFFVCTELVLRQGKTRDALRATKALLFTSTECYSAFNYR